MPIQDTRYDQSHYERPTRKWVCGRSGHSGACANGPDHHGKCQTTHECKPLKRGDRYYCTRNPGCNDGPKPDGQCSRPLTTCVPVLSRLALRKRVGHWLTVLTLGIIVTVMAGDKFIQIITPGPLSPEHAALQGDCETCHVQHPDTLLSLIKDSFHKVSPQEATEKCIKCHELNDKPLLAHNQFIKDDKQNVEITSCQQCHQEHRGLPLKDLAIKQHSCLACHSDIDAKKMKNHPKFENYPLARRNHIIFDHSRHFKKHFDRDKYKDRAKNQCIDCHKTDEMGQRMVLFNYEKSCGACHNGQIDGSTQTGSTGIAVFNLPGVDVETLKSAKLPIGDWPLDSDQVLSPVMSWFIAQDETIGAIDPELFDIEWFYLDIENKEQLKKVQTAIWKIKRFLLKLTQQGNIYLLDLLAKSGLEEKIEFKEMIHGLNLSSLKQLTARWIPNLQQQISWMENNQWQKFNQTESANTTPIELGTNEQWLKSGGWYVDQFALLYRAKGHTDKWFRNWIDFTALTANEKILQQVAHPKGPGVCMKCHSLDQDKDKSLNINWNITTLSVDHRDITNFSHQQHTNLFDPKGCSHCHKLDSDSDYLKPFKERDPEIFASNFKSIEITLCSNCHDDTIASSECQTCHRYHTGDIRVKLTDTKVEDAAYKWNE